MIHTESIQPGDYLCNAMNNMTVFVICVSDCGGCERYGHINDVVTSVWGLVSESKGAYVCELIHCSGTLSTWFKLNDHR